MASFIELTEVGYLQKTHPVLINVNMITDVIPFESGLAKTKVGLMSMDGENNPLVYQVTESYEEVKEMLKCLQTRA